MYVHKLDLDGEKFHWIKKNLKKISALPLLINERAFEFTKLNFNFEWL